MYFHTGSPIAKAGLIIMLDYPNHWLRSKQKFLPPWIANNMLFHPEVNRKQSQRIERISLRYPRPKLQLAPPSADETKWNKLTSNALSYPMGKGQRKES